MNLKYTNIIIELTDWCNMRCIMCDQHKLPGSMHGKKFQNEFLSVDNFTKLLFNLRSSSLDIGCISPSWAGESTFHPGFNLFMKMLLEENKKSRFFERFILNTNGIKFNSELSDIFLDYGRYFYENRLYEYKVNIFFSLDAITRKTFERVKGVPGENLERILKNIHYLLVKRAEKKTVFPRLTFQFIVMEENKHEGEQFLAYWQKYLSLLGVKFGITAELSYPYDQDEIFFRTKDCRAGEFWDKNLLIKENFLKKINFRGKEPEKTKIEDAAKGVHVRRPCFQLWNMCIISKTGFVTPCCKDNFLLLSIGNISKNSIEEIWLGEKLEAIRLAHIRGNFEGMHPCSSCAQPAGGSISDEDVVEYLKLINKSSLIEEYLQRVQGR